MEVSDLSKDGLSREVWKFNVYNQYLVLTTYAKETRATKRHKWVGPFWSSANERGYHSKLSRPEGMPDWVVTKAILDFQVHVAIGWCNPNHVLSVIKFEDVAKCKQ
jgi:hypothetical protein